MTFSTPVGCSNHRATNDSWRAGQCTKFMFDMPFCILLGSAAQWLGHPTQVQKSCPGLWFFFCPMLVMLITSFHISYYYNYYNYNYYYVQYQQEPLQKGEI